MSLSINSTFSILDFNALDAASQREMYQSANETHNVDLVRELNDLGMKPDTPHFSGPPIISNFMDIATKYDIILSFFKKLRTDNRLFTKQEFQLLSNRSWFKKGSLCRILGCDHLVQKIAENHLKHIKVPLKIAVIKDTESLTVSGYDNTEGLYDINSDQIKVYAEEITPVNRKLSREEIDELIQIIAVANFTDLNVDNIIVAQEGIYFIDTEFKSFSKHILWGKMGRFLPLIAEEDKEYFLEKVNAQMTESITIQEDNNYDSLKDTVDMYEDENLPQTKRFVKCKNKVLSLEYVGAKKAGTIFFRPNIFSFSLEQIF